MVKKIAPLSIKSFNLASWKNNGNVLCQLHKKTLPIKIAVLKEQNKID